MRETDVQVLAALRAALSERPELGALLSFYSDLYELQYRVKSQLPEPRLLEAALRRQRLEAGQPQITFDQLRVEEAAYRPLVSETAGLLQRHNPGRQAEGADWPFDRLVAQARDVVERWDTLTSPGPDGQEATGGALAVALALAPYLQRAAEATLPGLDLAGWVWARCPACGGEPNLALLDQERGGRRLLCSRCDALWTYVRVGCPYCLSKEAQNYFPAGDGLYRLYVCPACGRYLKTVDLRAARRPVLPVVERLLTVGMDLAVLQEGRADDGRAESTGK